MTYLLGLSSFFALFAADDPTKDPPAEQRKFLGTWQVEKLVAEGKDETKKTTDAMAVVFKYNDKLMQLQLILQIDGKDEETYTCTLPDDMKVRSPAKAIDFQEEKDQVPGIYTFDGDTLKICWNKVNPESKGRPTSFEPDKTNQWSLMSLKKKK